MRFARAVVLSGTDLEEPMELLTKEEVIKVLNMLEGLYPNADCELSFGNVFQLLIAVVLSAQTTDKKVNEVTADLFLKYPDLESMLLAKQQEIEEIIKKIGMYRVKAKNIMELCRTLKSKYDGKIPDTYEELITLPGVGRKTANVVLSNGFSIPAIAVDTHVFRVANRMGFVNEKNVLKTELSLQKRIPKERWSLSHHLFIWHGRRICHARKPACAECAVNKYCKYCINIKNA